MSNSIKNDPAFIEAVRRSQVVIKRLNSMNAVEFDSNELYDFRHLLLEYENVILIQDIDIPLSNDIFTRQQMHGLKTLLVNRLDSIYLTLA